MSGSLQATQDKYPESIRIFGFSPEVTVPDAALSLSPSPAHTHLSVPSATGLSPEPTPEG